MAAAVAVTEHASPLPQRATAVGSAILTALNAIFEDEKKRYSGGSDQGSGAAGNGSDPQANADPNGASQPSQDQPLGSAPSPDQAPQPVAPGSYTSAAIVLLTDGQTNTGPDPLDAAQQAADRGVRIFTVGVGTNQGDVVGAEGRYFRVSLDEDTLKKIAHNTAAAYYKASDESELMRIYQALSVRLIVGRDTLEITALFAGLAVLAFLLGGLLSQLWFNRL